MTHDDLIQRAVRWVRGRLGCKVAFAELTSYAGTTPDVFAFSVSQTVSVLVECKVSRSDFHRDKHKMGNTTPGLALGDRRWYLTPPGLLKASDLYEGWGLAECTPKTVRVIVEAPHVDRGVEGLQQDRILLASACGRHQRGMEWDQEIARFDPYGKHRHRLLDGQKRRVSRWTR